MSFCGTVITRWAKSISYIVYSHAAYAQLQIFSGINNFNVLLTARFLLGRFICFFNLFLHTHKLLAAFCLVLHQVFSISCLDALVHSIFPTLFPAFIPRIRLLSLILFEITFSSFLLVLGGKFLQQPYWCRLAAVILSFLSLSLFFYLFLTFKYIFILFLHHVCYLVSVSLYYFKFFM